MIGGFTPILAAQFAAPIPILARSTLFHPDNHQAICTGLNFYCLDIPWHRQCKSFMVLVCSKLSPLFRGVMQLTNCQPMVAGADLRLIGSVLPCFPMLLPLRRVSAYAFTITAVDCWHGLPDNACHQGSTFHVWMVRSINMRDGAGLYRRQRGLARFWREIQNIKKGNHAKQTITGLYAVP